MDLILHIGPTYDSRRFAIANIGHSPSLIIHLTTALKPVVTREECRIGGHTLIQIPCPTNYPLANHASEVQ